MANFKIESGIDANNSLVLSSSISDIVVSGNLKITGGVTSSVLDLPEH
jgi:hypothetical protein